MELETCKSSMFEPEDFISSMPNIVVSNILDRLPIQEAVRTSILAKNWRFKWTMLSQLVFDENFYKYLVKTNGESSYRTIVSRLLLHLKGVITKFVVYIEEESWCVLEDEDINHWILFLSGKGIKDLTFRKMGELPPLKLNTHLFSIKELKRLELINCCFDPPASFRGFPNLLSLELHNVRLDNGKFDQFVTLFPMLEILKMGITCYPDKMKVDLIVKLTNLKMLSLYLCNFYPTKIMRSGIFDLSQLQEVHLDYQNTNSKFIGHVAKNWIPLTFPGVKTLDLSNIYSDTGMTIPGAFDIIRSFPNLHSLEIRETNWNTVPVPGVCYPEVDYNTTELLQLRSVVFGFFIGSEDELRFIKHLLVCSPFLKKIAIHFRGRSDSDEKLFAKKLLKLHRASPVAEIDLCSDT